MNCKKAEENMLLYPELNPVEKIMLEQHLTSCITCSALFKHTQKQLTIINQVSKQEPEMSMPDDLTDRIMAALPDRKIRHGRKFIPDWSFNWSPLQTTLATCSFLLAFTFAMEFNTSGYTHQSFTLQNQPPVKNGVALSSNPEKFLQAKRSRNARFSLEKLINQNNTFAFSNQ